MASPSPKGPRSLTQEDNEEEDDLETFLKKYKLDPTIKQEPEEDNDLNEEEANQDKELDHVDKESEEQDKIVKAAFALCDFKFMRNQQQIVKTEEVEAKVNEETEHPEKEETEHQEKPLDSVLWLSEDERKRWDLKKRYEDEKEEWIKKRKLMSKYNMDEDDSDATLGLLSRWKIPAIPPEKIINPSLIEQCSEPIRKQMTKRDEEQSRLGLSKSQVTKKFLPLLEETEIGTDGIRVSVYGPDGKAHEMKMWPNEKKNELDLALEWRKFVEDYELKEICDFVTVWMFRHKLSGEICLAIDRTRLVFRKQVSKRISKAAFDDSD